MRHFNITYTSPEGKVTKFNDVFSRNSERAKQSTDKKMIATKKADKYSINEYNVEIVQINDPCTEEMEGY